MNVNIGYEDMTRPIFGPDNPFGDRKFLNQNTLAGHVEEQSMSEHSFRTQHLTHAILGYSQNPSADLNATPFVGSIDAAQANGFATINGVRATNQAKRDLKRKRKQKGDLDVVEGDGAYVGPWASWEGDDINPGDPDPEELNQPEEWVPEPVPAKKPSKPHPGVPGQETSVFHGKSMTDYQGRTYMAPPLAAAPHLNAEAGSQECFIPKVCIHTWTGHTAGVSVIRLLPKTSHLLLSGSLDTKIKVRHVFHKVNTLQAHLFTSSGMFIRKETAYGRLMATARR